MNIRRIANEVYQAMWSRPQCTLSRARNMRQEDIDRIAKAIDDAVQEALKQPVLVSEWQEQQSELTQLREQNRVLRANLVNCAVRLEAYYGNEHPVVRDAQAALAATSQSQPPYKEWCRHPDKCAGLASCPQDPTCAD